MSAIRIALNIGSLLLVAILGWLVMRILIGVMQPESLYVAEPIVSPARAVTSETQSVAYDFSTDPFAFGEVVIAPVEIFDDAPETTLNLKLVGIVSEGTATFRLSDGKDKAVRIGEEVMNGVTLLRTAKDFVTLDVNGETQKLTLERVKLGEKSNSDIIVRATPKTTQSTNLPTKAEIESLFSQVKLVPSMEIMPDRTTQLRGLKIQAKSGVDLSKFKLKSGDILTRVGPVMLNTGRPNIKEMRNLIDTGAAQDFEVIRDGKPVTIRIGQ